MGHFNEISSAYSKLMEIQADIEARERSDEIEYEAIVEKVFYVNLRERFFLMFCICLGARGGWTWTACGRGSGTVSVLVCNKLNISSLCQY